MRYKFHKVIVSDETLAELHALRAAAGLSKVSDGSMLQLVIQAGVEAERRALKQLSEVAA